MTIRRISIDVLEPIKTAAVQLARSNYRLHTTPSDARNGPMWEAERGILNTRIQTLNDLVQTHQVGVSIDTIHDFVKAMAEQAPETEEEAVEGFVAMALHNALVR